MASAEAATSATATTVTVRQCETIIIGNDTGMNFSGGATGL
jgi:hypothetical protein